MVPTDVLQPNVLWSHVPSVQNNYTEKCTAVNCFCLKWHATLISPGLLLKVTQHILSRVENYRLITRLLSAFNPVCVPHSVREHEQDRSELVSDVKVSGPLHSSPVDPLTPPGPSHFTPLVPFFPVSSLSPHAWGRVAARRTWWHLSWQQLSASPINYMNWLTPFYSASGNFYHYRHNILLDMLHAAVLNGGYALSPRVQTKSHIKKSPQRENSTDPSFARSHLDPPEETSSGVQFQRRDVWSGEGLD